MSTFAVAGLIVAVVLVARQREGVVVVGDSMTEMARQPLIDAGHAAGYDMQVEGTPGIRLSQRLDRLRQLSGRQAGPIVVELGTNDALQYAAADAMNSAIDQAVFFLATAKCVVFVDVGVLNGAAGLADVFNTKLVQAVSIHPNMHVFDWSGTYHQHTDWTLDLVHLRPEHERDYADLIIGAVKNDC